MAKLCFYFQVHQPYRIRPMRIFDVGTGLKYFNDKTDTNLNNERLMTKVASKCYLPMGRLWLEILKNNPDWRISFSISGITLEQMRDFSPETLHLFRLLAETGQVEFLAETYYHSLSFLYDKDEFTRQVNKQANLIEELFDQKPKILRNTELIYHNELAQWAAEAGYRGVLAEGADKLLGWRSPNHLYYPTGQNKIKLLLKNYKLSDDIAFRFSDPHWPERPLTAEKFASWVGQTFAAGGEIINLFMDYETFGEHQWADTGIFDFIRNLPQALSQIENLEIVTPSMAVKTLPAVGEIDCPDYVSWADTERDLSAWLENEMQLEAISRLYGLGSVIIKSQRPDLIEDWRRLQTSDHFYYMCTKWWQDGDVHAYFNPYASPYDAFMSFINALNDLQLRLANRK
ncbi:MAG: glycoside hydrolase family 57 protein [Patescibacteria group bacterium]